MNQKLRFVTIFTDCENVHLTKDVGQIPYFMYKTEGFDSTLVTYKNSEHYSYLEEEVKGLKLKFIPDQGRFLFFESSIFNYLWNNAGSIDVLNLFHFKKDNIAYLLAYKLRNSRGKAYIKLDIDLVFFKRFNALFFSHYRVKHFLLQQLTRAIFKLTDLFSIETEDAKNYLIGIYPELKEKLICIPNGVDDTFLGKTMQEIPFEKKENIIITVGRMGTDQKNTELLLESLALARLGDWKVYLLGPIAEHFHAYLDLFYLKYPHLKDVIVFKGNITERAELLNWYNRAKVFCLSSRYEGFSIVFPEAMYFGNYILTTPVSSAEYITDHGKLGSIVTANAADFARELENIISAGFLTAQRSEDVKKFARKNLAWSEIIKKLTAKLHLDA